MSEFDRSENFRRSIRRPRKQAPLPPTICKTTTKIEASESSSQADVSLIINRLLTTKRDFVASIPQPRVLDDKTEEICGDSHLALKRIQAQINKLEFNTALQQNQTIPVRPTTRTRYDAMESILNTGISDLKTNENNDDDDEIDDDNVDKFYRGVNTRSSVQGVSRKKIDPTKPATVQLQRTVSDSKKVEMLRKHIKQRDVLLNKKVDEEKVKRFEIYKERCKHSFKVN